MTTGVELRGWCRDTLTSSTVTDSGTSGSFWESLELLCGNVQAQNTLRPPECARVSPPREDSGVDGSGTHIASLS